MNMEDNGYKYLFGYYSNEEKIWYIQPRRFVLLKDKNKNIILGQFIQSNWFNKIYIRNKSAIFVVLKVEKEISSQTIEKDMNGLKNPFPTLYDVPPYVSRYSYFNLPWQLMNQCAEVLKEKDAFNFTIRAFNNPYDKLILSVRNPIDDILTNMRNSVNNFDGIDNENQKIMITLPSFEIPIH